MEDDDYLAIEQAVMATERGRRFLAAFLDRQRSEETAKLVAAAERLQQQITPPRDGPADGAMNDLRLGLYDMSEAIAKTKAEIASLKPDDGSGALDVASEELDAVVTATEEATSEILNAAEAIQEVAWALREQGGDSEQLDALDARAIEIYTCCSFQDLTGQRIAKVVKLLGYLEDRIATMTAIWNGHEHEAEGTRSADALTHDPLLNGPAMPGQGVDQSDVDALLSTDADAGGVAADDGAAADMDQSDIDALLNGGGTADDAEDGDGAPAEDTPSLAAAEEDVAVDMDQSDIDALLSGAADGEDEATEADEAPPAIPDEVLEPLAEADAAFDQLSEPEKQALYR